MNGWARIQYSMASAGTLAFTATGLFGFRVAGDPELLPLHTQAALASTLAIVLGQGWMILFTWASATRLRRLGVAGEAARTLARARDRVGALGGAAVAAALLHFGAAGRLYTSQGPGWIHGGAALAAILLQIAALAVERHELRRHQSAVSALAAAAGSAPAC